MYARYIPPAKPSQAAASHPPQEPSVPSAPIAAPAPATPYARYVPPSRNPHTPSASTAATTPAVQRAAPTSKTHLNAAAIPPPEALPPKIVFNYDDGDEDIPSPPKKRKLDSPEAAPIPVKNSTSVDTPSQLPNDPPNAKKDKKDKKRKSEEGNDHAKGKREGKDRRSVRTPGQNEEPGRGDKFVFGFDGDSVVSENGPEEEMRDAGAGNVAVSERLSLSDQQGAKKDSDVDTKEDARHDPSTRAIGRRNLDDVPARHKAVLDKAAKSMRKASRHVDPEAEDKEEEATEAVEAQGLEPLPQPEPVSQEELKPTYETLPSWIANPLRVTPQAKTPFTDLGITNEVAGKLDAKGYKDAFAVQTAVIPLLLPSPDRRKDVVVAAATGSGKTLSYVLPMVRDISQSTITRLRGLIVVPTRELVMQAKEVCEVCAGAFAGPGRKTVKVGISMGNKQFEQEQADLVAEQQRFDPAGYQQWLRQTFSKTLDASIFDDVPTPLVDHVMDYTSKVDILICTPGRLVDHIKRTPGFSLDYVRWLVVDEADKLLAQTFQNWLPAVLPLLETTNKPGAREFPDSNKSGVQKVILSATMTRDLTLLNELKLFRPKLVVLEGVTDSSPQAQENKTEHVLPELLEEFAIKIRDPELKPLYLVELLGNTCSNSPNGSNRMTGVDDDSDSSSAADSSSDSDTSSSEDESDSESEGSDVDDAEQSPQSKSVAGATSKKASFHSTALIFTKSNETAVRLSRLLSLLSPNLAPLIGTLTSTTRTSQRRKTLRAFTTHKLRILVASDLVARGIDLPDLDHVVNYDMPTSVASYVHRVGRTARANRQGKAWTLFTKTEAGWFWTAIAGKGESKSQSAAGSGYIKRSTKVEEFKISDRWDEDKTAHFESTLEKLGKEANEMRRKRR